MSAQINDKRLLKITIVLFISYPDMMTMMTLQNMQLQQLMLQQMMSSSTAHKSEATEKENTAKKRYVNNLSDQFTKSHDIKCNLALKIDNCMSL